MDLDFIGGADADRGRDLLTASLLLAFYNELLTSFPVKNANLFQPVQPPTASKTQARRARIRISSRPANEVPKPEFVSYWARFITDAKCLISRCCEVMATRDCHKRELNLSC
jgi:hypothetical protein